MTISVDLGRKATKQTNKQMTKVYFLICGIIRLSNFECSSEDSVKILPSMLPAIDIFLGLCTVTLENSNSDCTKYSLIRILFFREYGLFEPRHDISTNVAF